MFGSAGGAAPHMKSGRLRALAVGSAKPSRARARRADARRLGTAGFPLGSAARAVRAGRNAACGRRAAEPGGGALSAVGGSAGYFPEGGHRAFAGHARGADGDHEDRSRAGEQGAQGDGHGTYNRCTSKGDRDGRATDRQDGARRRRGTQQRQGDLARVRARRRRPDPRRAGKKARARRGRERVREARRESAAAHGRRERPRAGRARWCSRGSTTSARSTCS